MRVVIQRVAHAKVCIDGEVHSQIGNGLLVLLGIQPTDGQDDIDYLVQKITHLRIFDDAAGVMNLCVRDVAGEVLVVSQFTLMASTRKGNRPSYIHAAPPAVAEPLYEAFVEQLSTAMEKRVQTGRFGADMQVSLLNDGPVTICIDSRHRE
ncbi:MAG: D-tyrosyl-tRNA(Tyr) deacylase [Alloprevotella sp.]|nr:MAG: D-tyrosyl-tRNA(Tyr) deacylase [Alloprevotella sp.]